VTIAPSDFDRWLDGNTTDADEAIMMLNAPPRGTFIWHEVSTAVNRVANDGADLILPCSPEDIAIAEAASKKPKERAKKAAAPEEDSGQGSLF
jgi:hypothetical protein